MEKGWHHQSVTKMPLTDHSHCLTCECALPYSINWVDTACWSATLVVSQMCAS